MNVDPIIKSQIIHLAGSLAGQIKSMSSMVRNNGNPANILATFLAIQGLYLLLTEKFDSAIRMDLNIRLHTPIPPHLQTEEYLQLIEQVKVLLPKSTLKELDKMVRQLRKEKIIP